MAKYKVKVNPKTPSDKDISKSQDFNDVLKQASSKKYNLNHVRKKCILNHGLYFGLCLGYLFLSLIHI